MDFLESAVILVPFLTGMALTVYDGDFSELTQFERQYCFSPQIQKIYTATELGAFLEGGSEQAVYEIVEPLESHLIVFQAEGQWFLLGPYVEEEWKERPAQVRLGTSETAVSKYKSYRSKLPIVQRSYALQLALLLVKHMDAGSPPRNVETIHMDAARGVSLACFDTCEDALVINRRYRLEDRFISAVSRGETEAAYGIFRELQEVCSSLRFVSNDLKDQIAGAAIARTLMRMGAKQAGLGPVLIDSISQEFAQKMRHTASAEELKYLMARMVERLCAEVRKKRETSYSVCVRRAMDYVGANLNKTLTTGEIARAAGINQQQFVKTFGSETGMTVKQYLAKKRCDAAAELLRDSSSTVQEIAAYVGYADNNYFSKVFKLHYGVSPRDYRRARRPCG